MLHVGDLVRVNLDALSGRYHKDNKNDLERRIACLGIGIIVKVEDDDNGKQRYRIIFENYRDNNIKFVDDALAHCADGEQLVLVGHASCEELLTHQLQCIRKLGADLYGC